jgi:hypothetical protein
MKNIDSLVEQHFRESDSHLRHIDELMAQAELPPRPVTRPADLAALLAEIKATRARLSHALEQLRGKLTSHGEEAVAEPAASLNSALETAGQQYENALAAVFDLRGVSEFGGNSIAPKS